MSLDFDLTKIANRQTLCFDAEGIMTARTESLIWATMIVGIDAITESNYREFFTRLRMSERAVESLLVGEGRQPVLCTLEEVRAHIGLSTNAARLSKSQFAKRLCENLRHKVEGEVTQ